MSYNLQYLHCKGRYWSNVPRSTHGKTISQISMDSYWNQI